jgi:hypothetical protein
MFFPNFVRHITVIFDRSDKGRFDELTFDFIIIIGRAFESVAIGFFAQIFFTAVRNAFDGIAIFSASDKRKDKLISFRNTGTFGIYVDIVRIFFVYTFRH